MLATIAITALIALLLLCVAEPINATLIEMRADVKRAKGYPNHE